MKVKFPELEIIGKTTGWKLFDYYYNEPHGICVVCRIKRMHVYDFEFHNYFVYAFLL